MRRSARVLLAALALAPLASTAQTVIYRCVAADGAVTLQNDAKCPKGAKQQKRVLPVPTPAPAPPITAAPPARPMPVVEIPQATTAGPGPAGTPASARPEPDATTLATPPRPAPPLYVCLTSSAERYYSASAESSRCAPVATRGLDGGPGAAEACEMVQDRCEPVPEAERCTAWADWRRTSEQASIFDPERADAARADLARVDAAVAGSVCAR